MRERDGERERNRERERKGILFYYMPVRPHLHFPVNRQSSRVQQAVKFTMYNLTTMRNRLGAFKVSLQLTLTIEINAKGVCQTELIETRVSPAERGPFTPR